MSEGPRILTSRLELIAATARTATASVNDHRLLGELLDAHIPREWPPIDLADVQEHVAAQLESGEAVPGWCVWYVVRNPTSEDPRRVLVGTVGGGPKPKNQPEDPPVEVGYGILDSFQRQGFATEATRAMCEWMFANSPVPRVIAQTFEWHPASIGVMRRIGFRLVGVSPNDEHAAERDRQGRGRLMLFELTRELLVRE